MEYTDDKDELVWSMVELLSGAIPCKKDRHKGEFVETATFKELAKTGIDKPTEQIFKAKTDRGSNMIKGYEDLDHDPCTNHLVHTSVHSYYEHPSVAPTLKKGRAIVGCSTCLRLGSRTSVIVKSWWDSRRGRSCKMSSPDGERPMR